VEDSVQRLVTIPAQPARVVSLDPGATAFLRRMGVSAVGLPVGADRRTIAAAHPNLLILPFGTLAPAANRVAKTDDVPTFVMAGGLLQPIEHSVATLGIATGRASAGRALAFALRSRRLAVAQKVASLPPTTVFVDTGLGFTITGTSAFAHLVKLAGGKLVGLRGQIALSPKQRLQLNPQVYLLTPTANTDLATMQATRVLKQLQAVQSGRVYPIDPSQASSSSLDYPLLERLARLLHPAAFK